MKKTFASYMITSANTTTTESKEENTMNRYNRVEINDCVSVQTNISINKIEVTLERYTTLKGTGIERVLRTIASIMAETDRHMAAGDQYFNYSRDKIESETEIDMLISTIYKKEGNLTEIERSICFRRAKAKSEELSDHYWAIPHNN